MTSIHDKESTRILLSYAPTVNSLMKERRLGSLTPYDREDINTGQREYKNTTLLPYVPMVNSLIKERRLGSLTRTVCDDINTGQRV